MSALLQLGQTVFETTNSFDCAANLPGNLWLLFYTVNKYTLIVNKRSKNSRGHQVVVGVSVNGILPKASTHALIGYRPSTFVPMIEVKRRYRQHYPSLINYIMHKNRCSLLWQQLPPILLGKVPYQVCGSVVLTHYMPVA